MSKQQIKPKNIHCTDRLLALSHVSLLIRSPFRFLCIPHTCSFILCHVLVLWIRSTLCMTWLLLPFCASYMLLENSICDSWKAQKNWRKYSGKRNNTQRRSFEIKLPYFNGEFKSVICWWSKVHWYINWRPISSYLSILVLYVWTRDDAIDSAWKTGDYFRRYFSFRPPPCLLKSCAFIQRATRSICCFLQHFYLKPSRFDSTRIWLAVLS